MSEYKKYGKEHLTYGTAIHENTPFSSEHNYVFDKKKKKKKNEEEAQSRETLYTVIHENSVFNDEIAKGKDAIKIKPAVLPDLIHENSGFKDIDTQRQNAKEKISYEVYENQKNPIHVNTTFSDQSVQRQNAKDYDVVTEYEIIDELKQYASGHLYYPIHENNAFVIPEEQIINEIINKIDKSLDSYEKSNETINNKQTKAFYENIKGFNAKEKGSTLQDRIKENNKKQTELKALKAELISYLNGIKVEHNLRNYENDENKNIYIAMGKEQRMQTEQESGIVDGDNLSFDANKLYDHSKKQQNGANYLLGEMDAVDLSTMTKDEIDKLDYIRGKYGDAAAEQYVNYILDDVRGRLADEMTENLKNSDFLTQSAYALFKGAENTIKGVETSLTGKYANNVSATDITWQKYMQDQGVVGRAYFSAVNSIGGMLPAMAVSGITGLSSAGNLIFGLGFRRKCLCRGKEKWIFRWNCDNLWDFKRSKRGYFRKDNGRNFFTWRRKLKGNKRKDAEQYKRSNAQNGYYYSS